MVSVCGAREKFNHRLCLPLTCRKHSSHIPFLRNAPRILTVRRSKGCHRRDFFWQSPIHLFFRQSPIYLFRLPELYVPRFGTGKGTTRSLVVIRNKICSIGRSKGGCYD